MQFSRNLKRTCSIGVAAAALFVSGASHAADVSRELSAFLAQRPKISATLSEPIATCVARKDTDHAVFRGCIDWHSAVHGTWALTAYTWKSGDTRYRPLIESVLNPKRLAQERAYLAQHPRFEMPYGRAWFLRLAIDHQRAFGSSLLTAFADDVAASLVDYYSKNPPDPRAVAYDNASWALINLYDYGRARKDQKIVGFVEKKIRTHYLRETVCPVQQLELDQNEFMAVCTNWAWLVQLVMPAEQFQPWLTRFLPGNPPLVPITNPTRTRKVGLNFSRAWGLWRLYSTTGDVRFLKSYLAHFSETYSHPNLWKGDYIWVAHWVAQFGMFALMVTYCDTKTP